MSNNGANLQPQAEGAPTMSEDNDLTLDWRAVKKAARTRRRGGDRDGAGPDAAPRRWPPVEVPRAQLLAFPAGRRIGEIRRLAEQMRRLSYERGEAHLKQQLRRKAETLQRRGFSDLEISSQVKSLEAAVRGELWRREFEPTGSRGGPKR